MDFHIFERPALGAASTRASEKGDISTGQVLFARVVFSIPGDGCLTTVEERARCKVVCPKRPVPVPDTELASRA